MAVKSEKIESLYAVIRTGGKQYRVSQGQKITLDRLSANPGDDIKIDEVLLVSSGEAEAERKLVVGTPLVAGASVTLKVLSHNQEKKVRVFKKKRRTGYTKRQGHRQQVTQVRVESIAF